MAIIQSLTFPYFETIANSDYKLQKCRPEGVTKFGPASFYNFEQDNEPLYDLEDQTHFNWQKLGFPTNVPTSIHLLVSADAPEEVLTCNSNVFTTLQEALDSLPKYINTNIRISVASFGDLGSITLEGITVDPRGNKLEIVNVNCYDRVGRSQYDFGENETQRDAYIETFATDSHAGNQGLVKSFVSSGVDSRTGSGFGGIANFLLKAPFAGLYGYGPDVRGFDGVEAVFSSTAGTLDERAVNGYTAFITPIPGVGAYTTNPAQIGRLTVGEVTFSEAAALPSPTPKYRIKGTLDLLEEITDEPVVTDFGLYDPSSFNQQTTELTPLKRTEQANTPSLDGLRARVKVNLYGNYLTSLRVSNCQGQIYFSNFYCKGSGPLLEGDQLYGLWEVPSIGIHIEDSNNVFLQSIACSNYTNFGICLTNSKVTFIRSLYIHRCYGRTIANPAGAANIRTPDSFEPYEGEKNTRLSKPWLENIKSLDAPDYDRSAGLAAFNSEITFSRFETQYINSFLQNGTDMTGPYYKPGYHTCKMISRCSTGIRLVNSIMRGGQGIYVGQHTTEDTTELVDYINVEGNANYGIDAINSQINLDANLQLFQNARGLRAKSSHIGLDSFKIDNNHLYGVKLDDSKLTYGLLQLSAGSGSRFDYANTTNIYSTANTKQYQFIFDSNGHHILAKNSIIEPGPLQNPLPSSFGRMIMNNAHAALSIPQKTPLPGCILSNTKAEFLHLASLRIGVAGQSLLGAHFYLDNNSDVTFMGSASALTCLTSPTEISEPTVKKYVGISVNNGSTVKFRGPTAIYDGAVNVLANNNSNIIFEPHKKTDGTLDVEGFSLDNPANHTMVELKSIRSCLVANNNSNIIIEDLGSYSTNWGISDQDQLGYYPELNPTYTSAGFIQFYPNPNDSNLYAEQPYQTALNKRGVFPRMSSAGGKYYWGINYISPGGVGLPYELSSITNGGVCLRALNNSHVKVKNVNFPCGWWNASGVIYDVNDPLGYCGKTFIWNIANNSTLKASHLSVSSSYPLNVGYFGPSAVWTSGANQIAYGAPSSTPDTSTLSVLDFFGYGRDNAWQLPGGNVKYGFDTPQNQGPFRLYVGVDSLATQLYQDGKPGYIQQLFAQGYNASGSLSAVTDTSAVYGKLLRITDEGTLEGSGYYYNNEFVKVDPNAILLDESAANTFANAKNGAMGTSNRAQICSIFNASTEITGEGKRDSLSAYGSGFKSPNVFDILEEN